jgi:hypothetical protein
MMVNKAQRGHLAPLQISAINTGRRERDEEWRQWSTTSVLKYPTPLSFFHSFDYSSFSTNILQIDKSTS